MNSPLDQALREFEATEANLMKLERLWSEIEAMIPEGVCFFEGSPEEHTYDDLCRSFRRILPVLPAIDGYKIDDRLHSLDGIAQARLDALEFGEPEHQFRLEAGIRDQAKQLREYRFRFNAKQRDLTRGPLKELVDKVDGDLRAIEKIVPTRQDAGTLSSSEWDLLSDHIAQIDTLLGSAANRPPRWPDLRRHIRFAQLGDFEDIRKMDWPAVKSGLIKLLHAENDPLPVTATDLADLVASHPTGPVASKLKWDRLSDEEFERLIFCLISNAAGYENPEWLTKTNAPDRGRDLSVTRVVADDLGGMRRVRVIMQCKHWLSRSVCASDVSSARDLTKLWEPPRVEALVIATSGRFTTDAIQLVEKHNASDSALRIEMWPESHLELQLAKRPALVADFALR